MVFESKSVIVRSDNVFFSHKFDNNCSDTSAGKKASGCLKVSRVAELVGASLDDVLPIVVSKANSSVLLLFTVQISGRSKTYAVFNSAERMRARAGERLSLISIRENSPETVAPGECTFASPRCTSHKPRTLPQMKSMHTSWRLLGDSNILYFCCHPCYLSVSLSYSGLSLSLFSLINFL